MPPVLLVVHNFIRKDEKMKVSVTDECISCGLCVDMCPEVFEMQEIAQSNVNPVPEELENGVREAADACPVNAIIVEE